MKNEIELENEIKPKKLELDGLQLIGSKVNSWEKLLLGRRSQKVSMRKMCDLKTVCCVDINYKDSIFRLDAHGL